MNKKLLLRTITIVITILFLTPNNIASAAVKAGAKCTKPGTIQKSGSKTYVCAKVGKTSVWIQAGVSESKKPSNSPTPTTKIATPTCTTGIGTRLVPTYVNSPEGLTLLQIKNPTNCTISYTITGQITCNHFKSARTVLPASGTGTLYPNQVATLWPQQVFPVANQSCQQLQKASGAGPEYGAGILSFSNYSNFSNFNYVASVIGISN